MKVVYSSQTGTFQLHMEGNQKDIFGDLATFQEIFSHTKCQCCDSAARFVRRVVEDNDFYEMHCTNLNCRAKLAFGQHKKGDTLFPKLKDEDGGYIKNGGWVKWNGEKK